jgi:hypothetical protein
VIIGNRPGHEQDWGFQLVTEQRACPLCQITKPIDDFRKSHFIPASLYHSGKKGLEYGTQTGAGRLEREIKDLLLCSTCESVLDNGGESYVLSLIAPKVMNKFPLHRKLSLAQPRESYPDVSRFSGDDLGFDMEKFAHFALGIVWRAAIYDWTIPNGTILPKHSIGEFEPPIRNYLLGGEFPPDTSVIVIVCSDDQSRRVWNTPTILMEANCLNFRFLARGVFFRVMMGYQMPQAFRAMSCNSPSKCLFYGSAAHRMPEIMAIFKTAKAG